jgi:hypothetical protein
MSRNFKYIRSLSSIKLQLSGSDVAQYPTWNIHSSYLNVIGSSLSQSNTIELSDNFLNRISYNPDTLVSKSFSPINSYIQTTGASYEQTWKVNVDITNVYMTQYATASLPYPMFSQDIELPNNVTVTQLSMSFEPPQTHTTLPTTPYVRILKITPTTGAVSTVATVNPSYASVAAYQAARSMSGDVSFVVNNDNRYTINVMGENGTGSVQGLQIYNLMVKWIPYTGSY